MSALLLLQSWVMKTYFRIESYILMLAYVLVFSYLFLLIIFRMDSEELEVGESLLPKQNGVRFI